MRSLARMRVCRASTCAHSVERGQCPPRISLNETPRTKRDDAENEQTVHNMTLHRQRGTAVRLPPAQTPLKRVRRQTPLAPHPPPAPLPVVAYALWRVPHDGLTEVHQVHST